MCNDKYYISTFSYAIIAVLRSHSNRELDIAIKPHHRD